MRTISNFNNSSIIFTQLSQALCSRCFFLPGWPKRIAAFSKQINKRTLQSSFGNHPCLSDSHPCYSDGVHHPLSLLQGSEWPCCPGLAQWVSLGSILGTSCKASPAPEHFPGTVSETGPGENAHSSPTFLGIKTPLASGCPVVSALNLGESV